MEKIRITNDVMFAMVMRNPVFCQDVIERILGRKVSEIKYDDTRVNYHRP